MTEQTIEIDYLLALFDADAEDNKQRTPERKSYGPQALLPFDGLVRVRPVDMYTSQSKAGNAKFVAVWRVDDEYQGQPIQGILYDHIAYTGTKSDGTPNALKVVHLLRSAGATMPAGKIEPAAIIELFMKAEQAYVNVSAEEFNGKWSSKVQEYVTQKRMNSELLAGTARTPRLAAVRAQVTVTTGTTTVAEPSEAQTQTTQEIKDILGGIA